ncbi:hypothetical protein [Staphylospora marina]|uniref:hypothetical protein n=1 Tax=Staphylospora marina TaxID=2490858 RepID=UPI000F5BE490|nr:hypothetical protein [Staphylospora marina]
MDRSEKNAERSGFRLGNRGSSTLEYVIIVAVGAILAGLLFLSMSDGEGLIQSALKEKVHESMGGSLNGGSSTGQPPDRGGSPETGGIVTVGGPSASETPGSSPPDKSAVQDSPPTAPPSSRKEDDGGFRGWWNKTVDYITSGQILKDTGHILKETADFVVLDDAAGCITGQDTDGQKVGGWERGLSCVSLIPVAKPVKGVKYLDDALEYAGKLDDKLADTGIGRGLKSAKEKFDELVSGWKKKACACPPYVVDNRVPLDNETILKDRSFKRTKHRVKGATVYEKDGKYYHRDTLHKGEGAHLEVYDKKGRHIGEADPQTGEIKPGTRDPKKKLDL